MAGGLKSQNDEEIISDINITPFVDVVLVLLVIFMVTATIIVQRGLKIELPEAVAAEQMKDQITFNVLVAPNGAIAMDGAVVAEKDLIQKGLEAKASGKRVVVMISADRHVEYDAVVRVMDAFRQGGVTEFALQWERKKSE
jgi:biopolymer transport protein ExbD